MGKGFHHQLVRIAIEKGYLDHDRAEAAYRMMESERAAGREIRLQDFLLRHRFLSRDQLVEVRRVMARQGVAPRIGDFEILSRLGRGTSGVVYRARQRSLDREVALKILSSHLAANGEFVGRFFREARAAAQVSHPNVVQVFDVGHTRRSHYIVMEYVPGPTLERILEAEGRIDQDRALGIAEQIASALAHIESCGMVHRDIKPGNIMVTAKGVAKLADLGLALRPGETPEASAGTPYYMPPEQARGWHCLDIRSDIYALGCTLFHAVTGSPPYRGRTAAETLRMHAAAPIPDPRALGADISEEFARLMMRMMQKEPARRFSSAAELCAALDAVRTGRGFAPPARPVANARSRPLWWLYAAVGAAVLLLAALLLALAAWRINALRRVPRAPAGPVERAIPPAPRRPSRFRRPLLRRAPRGPQPGRLREPPAPGRNGAPGESEQGEPG